MSLPSKTTLRFRAASLLMLSACLLVAVHASVAAAAGTSSRQALTTSLLRVCADPANMPYSNEALEGFENRIIALIAEDLGLEVRYTWYPQSTGFVRNTLRVRECDLISGITTTSQMVQNTNPYYHSTYVMVYRRDSGITATTMGDPQLADKRLGVVAGTPPSNILAQLGLLDHVKPYQLIADTRRHIPAREAVLDVANGDTDVAFVWGPIAAWHARDVGEPLVLVPLLEENPRVRLTFRVSMAVRYNETDWKRLVNRVLEQRKDDIDAILHEYGVPLLNDRGELISPEH